MSHLIHPTRESLELAAEQALATAEAILGEGLRDDPVQGVGILLMGLHLYSLKRASGTGAVWIDALRELRRLELALEVLEE